MTRYAPDMDDVSIEVHAGAAPADALALRDTVFVSEQGVSQRDERDGRDPDCIHLLARRAGRAVGCARLRPLADSRAKVERVAVVPDARTLGLGRRIMDALEVEARQRGWPDLVLHAQDSAVTFYDRLGWERVGDAFVEAGILHQEMRKRVGGARTG